LCNGRRTASAPTSPATGASPETGRSAGSRPTAAASPIQGGHRRHGFADWQLSYADNSGKLLDSPDINPAAFLASSATTQAHQVAGQLLIAHNIDDAVIPLPERPGGGKPAARRILTGGRPWAGPSSSRP